MAAVARSSAGVLPPASPFAELLRRSRFASYDPLVKQTYGAPKSYTRRGNWGLKRPIVKRRHESYITLKSYEDHAQYVEWNSAEKQVRFIRRFEELNVTPTIESQSAWAANLGPVAHSLWLTDSEFDTARDSEFRYLDQEKTVTPPEPMEDDLKSLGKRGPGNYGANMEPSVVEPLIKRRSAPWDYRQPNINAMSPGEFDAYIEKLRELRPKFIKHVRNQIEEKVAHQLANTTLNNDLSDLQLGVMNTLSNDHVNFLYEHFEETYAKRDTTPAAADPESGDALPKDFVAPKIKPQPHRNGGLMYAHPTMLDTYFTNPPRPAFVLQMPEPSAKWASSHDATTVSFAGVVAQLEKPRSAIKPLFKEHSGPSSGYLASNVVKVRVDKFKLVQPPDVVGKAGQGTNGVRVNETVVEATPETERKRARNPAVPGSYAYVSASASNLPPMMPITMRGQRRGNVTMKNHWNPKRQPAPRVDTNVLVNQMKGLAATNFGSKNSKKDW